MITPRRETPAPPPSAAPGLKHDLRAIIGDGVAYSLMLGLGEAYLPAFVLTAGLGEVSAGLVATLPMLAGGLLQLVTPFAVRRLGSYRRWVVACAALQAVSFVPLIVSALSGSVSRAVVFLAAAAYWGFGMATSPAWNTWVSALVPERIRASFFANRIRASQIALFGAFLAGGLLLHYGEAVAPSLTLFGVLFALAMACRLASMRYLASQSEPRGVREVIPVLPSLRGRTTREGSHYRIFLLFLAMQFPVQIAAPYFTPYMLGPLSLSYARFALLTGMAFAGRFVALPVLGRLARRGGTRLVLGIGAGGIVPLPALWLVSQSFAYLLVLQLLAGTAWGAFELGSLMSVFEHTEERERTAFLSFFNLANAVTIAGGAIAGSILFRAVGGGVGAYAALFLVSSLLRAPVLLALIGAPKERLPAEPLPLRTLAVRPSAGALQRPILAAAPPGGPDAAGPEEEGAGS